MRRLVTISYTDLDAGGGVPAFNRALHASFPDRECIHFCWTDYPWCVEVDRLGESEWGRARKLNEYLVRSRKVTVDDVVVADGFWAAGLDHLPLAVSHSHGIWSHLTLDDVRTGKQPDMPEHHAAQVVFRQRWVDQRKHLTAVSDFIAEQMLLQWGFKVDRVINNGIDTELYKPMEKSNRYGLKRPFIIHGVNDHSNSNKGWDHIEHIMKESSNITIQSLDDARFSWMIRSDFPWEKHHVIAQADLIVHPSGYEGNSIFIAEALACGVPVVGYDVGFLAGYDGRDMGIVMDRNQRSPQLTLEGVRRCLSGPMDEYRIRARKMALRKLSLFSFSSEWRSYVEEIENA